MKVFRNILICLLLLMLHRLAAQETSIDSLEKVLDETAVGNKRVGILIELGREYESVDHLKAFDNARRALALADTINDDKQMGKALNLLGDLYWFSGDYASSSEQYFKALKIFEKLKDKEGTAECYRNIGWIYQGQNNFALTLQYYKKSMAMHEEMGLKAKLIANYDDMGIVYKMMGKYPEALEYANKTIQLARELKSERGLATGYGNLGSIYFDMGDYQKCIESYETARQLHANDHDNYNISENYNGMAECYLRLGKPDKTIEYANKAITISKQYDYKTNLMSSYKKLARAYAVKKNYAEAFQNIQLYAQFQDSTFNEKNSRQINEMSAKYESEKKELQISSLEKDKKLSEEKLEREKNFKIYLGIFCLMILGFAFMLFRGNVQKKKANVALSHAYKEIEVKNKDITDSINYSKHIQEATLPPKELKYKLFPDAFVLFKPKDIVSGDFYWYTEKNGVRLMAACDCTGHGVPGALMSMIGNNLLHQIVNEKGLTTPSLILDQLHLEIRKALKQDEGVESRDGMDIALIAIRKGEIEFAGAQRPLWIIHKDEVKEIKGNKFSIGGLQTEERRTFTNHVVKTENGQAIYLFSDGFVDQFGGEHGKKFMTKNFRELLLHIYEDHMALQEITIEKTIEKWRGNREQVDDILVIGVRV